ncbi:haloalkane dehalogenase [Alphaproteobacteria bacterium]|nr:haloalkane dehalogenase [Alphaproteobacteria bacterium]MDB4106506.1 haloalkane dehalogenase [bacterium]MDC0147385.1 haloalkane dehalogenase [Alphaproteobacteria bacterium]
MDVLVTPDARFEDLPDFEFTPHYAQIPDGEGGTLNLHYVDAGPRDGQAVVMIHGNPTWSFMWRRQIADLAQAGYRAIAIDLIGMGRSDKPTKRSDYTIARHVSWVDHALFEVLKLTSVHFILHDWGGIIGLRVIADRQAETASVIMSNTGMPVIAPDAVPAKMARKGAGMLRIFQLYVRYRKNWQHWKLLARFLVNKPTPDIVRAYAAPYPSPAYLTGNRQFTQMLPTRNDNPILADNWVAMQKLKRFEKPFLCLFSDKDQVAAKGYHSVRPIIPGTRAYAPVILKGGSHFLLEDVGPAYSQEMLIFLKGQNTGNAS